MSADLPRNLQTILHSTVDNKLVFGATVCLQSPRGSWCGAAGNFQVDEPFFIASTTKLFVTAIILRLRQEGRIVFDDNLSKYLPYSVTSDLHFWKGKDLSSELTIQHLLAHTSGLPDYFQQKRANGKSLQDELTKGHDQYWSFEKILEETKNMKPLFHPGQKGKAHYSDTNYQLLGKIIENITQKEFRVVMKEVITDPLGLHNTYMYQDLEDKRPKNIYFKDKELAIPMAMASFGPDGGIVSTAQELMVFTEAFFSGKLFPKRYIDELKLWRNIFFPLQSGIGIHRFKLPWVFSPFKPFPELIGHSGLSGAFAFYCPTKEVYLTGTVNQISSPGISFRLMIKLLNQI